MRRFIFSIALLFAIQLSVYSQVGIGTTAPDPSSILDITSTTQGVLTPRMTTAQRTAIASPAEGLLVFDTDLDVFYFYNGGVWLPLEGAEKRNNYKLVKSIADLADELTGAKYVLNEDYLYEINGTITFDFPVDLNGAYIEGRDTGEDVLVNGSGSTFFSGSKGGHFKSLLIDGGGQQIFNITGSGAESVVGYSVLVRNASSLGILSNLYAVFFEVLQVVSTNGGLQASNVTSFFMDKVFWTDSNTGTFLKLSGTFGNLQIANGRAVVDTGETGIDVSANPTITVSASLTSLNFTGTGTIIKKYTTGTYIGYNFTNKWDIDSPGILLEKDAAATGNLYLTTIVDTDITAVNTPKKIAGTTAGLNLFRTSSPANNRLAYLGNKTRYVTYTGSMSASTGINNKVFNFYVAKNGAILIESKQSRKIANANDVGSISISGVVQLSTGDYLELWVENTTDATDITIEAMNFVIR